LSALLFPVSLAINTEKKKKKPVQTDKAPLWQALKRQITVWKESFDKIQKVLTKQ
jgi:hypothetical protein